MDYEVKQLVEMGASPAQARAALRQYKDLMEAAEKIFEGKFDDVKDGDEDVTMSSSDPKRPTRIATPENDSDGDELMEDDDEDDDGFVDYDSDYDLPDDSITRNGADADPYAGIFYSKDRREEVVEIEEEPKMVTVTDSGTPVKLLTQGQWMKGCPEGGEQSFLFSLYTQLGEGQCRCPQDCGASTPRELTDFFAIYPAFPLYIKHLRQIVEKTCSRCQSQFCFACGESISQDKTKRPSAGEYDALFHCSNLQGVILGIGLSMIEQMFVEQTEKHYSAKSDGDRSAKRRKADTGTEWDDDDDFHYPGGTKKAKGGIGYAGNVTEDHSGQLEALAAQREKDENIGSVLSAVRVYLPSLHRKGGGHASDYLVHPTALAHLRRRFNFVCSTLLRNDSLADMSERSVLYYELLEWLETISNHEALASMMAMPIMAVTSVKDVTTKKTKDGGHIRERTLIYTGSESPRELLEGIAIQARAAVKGLEGTRPVDDQPAELTEEQKRMTTSSKGKGRESTSGMSEETLKLFNFCQRILSTNDAIDKSLRDTKGDRFVERLHASLTTVYTSSSNIPKNVVRAGLTPEATQKIYLDWANHVRFEYRDLAVPPNSDNEDQTPNYKSYYNNEARMLFNSDIPKRSLAIAKELAILSTNLPVAWDSSIFLCADETRVDIIKVLITGPAGTPYHNGCYLFDVFLGPSYSHGPPSVKYMTTGGGKYRFNPNLYADGKVCLSLLGTWQGPGWVAGKSTLLQVLISIQSMILCDEPYLNEPGWASSAGTPQSHAYSANIRRMVVKTAMLGNLRNPPEPFEDIIKTHYRLKMPEITAQLDGWLAEDDGKPMSADGGGYGGPTPPPESESSSSGFKKDIEEMKQEMIKLQ